MPVNLKGRNFLTLKDFTPDEIEKLHGEGRLLRFAPSVPVTVSRLEKDLEKLGELYWLGWEDGIAALGQMKEYLGIA